MTTATLEAPEMTIETTSEHALTLRESTLASRVSFTWWGTSKTLSADQREQIGQHFGADATLLSAGKKLVNTKHSAFRKVTAIKGQIIDYWKGHSLPFPEEGIRLIRRESLDNFAAQMQAFRDDLDDAVNNLSEHFEELKQEAMLRLGDLFNPADYPTDIRPLFGFHFDFPNTSAPDYLMELRPDLYEKEAARVAARFEEAVKLAEEAFIAEFQDHVAHLCERLTRDEETGEAKVFRDSAIGNLTDFFNRFRELNIHSNEQLDSLVEQAKSAVKGRSPAALRGSTFLRQELHEKLSEVSDTLSTMTTRAPRRRIDRKKPAQADNGPMTHAEAVANAMDRDDDQAAAEASEA